MNKLQAFLREHPPHWQKDARRPAAAVAEEQGCELTITKPKSKLREFLDSFEDASSCDGSSEPTASASCALDTPKSESEKPMSKLAAFLAKYPQEDFCASAVAAKRGRESTNSKPNSKLREWLDSFPPQNC